MTAVVLLTATPSAPVAPPPPLIFCHDGACHPLNRAGFVTDGSVQRDWAHCVGVPSQVRACRDAHDAAFGPSDAPGWLGVAQCESGLTWDDAAGSFEGGLQFMWSTWLANGGGQYAPHAYQATPDEQMVVANTLSDYGADLTAWPTCGADF